MFSIWDLFFLLKIEWLDGVIKEFIALASCLIEDNIEHKPLSPKFIFITHSFGAHLVQRMCVIRPDVLSCTQLLVHLMPFIRFDPPMFRKALLSGIARYPATAISTLQAFSRLAAKVPKDWIDAYLNKTLGIHDYEGRELALNLVCQPVFAKNFLELGLEELREVPERYDVSAGFCVLDG